MRTVGRPATAAAAQEIVRELRVLELEHAEAACARRVALGRRGRAAGAAIAEVGSPAGIVDRAGAVLGEHLGVDRVLVSAILAQRAEPRALWERGAPEVDRLDGLGFALGYPRIEADVVRRQGARAVDVARAGPRVPASLLDAFDWTAYVVAPLVVADTTVGLLHAQAPDAPGAADLVEPIGHYATALGEALAIATMRATLRRRHEDRRAAIRWLSRQGGEDETRPIAVPGAQEGVGRLTPREREILGMLAQGMTNRAIGAALVISESTVKYHVRNVLRKLGSTSRAEAVARYRTGIDCG